MTTVLGLIGAGRIGSALGRLATAAGLDVVVSNSRGPETLADLVRSWGRRAQAADVRDAALAGDLVVVTVPLGGCATLPVAELDRRELTSSEPVQRQLPGSRVVKAFNNIDFRRLELLARPAGAADRSALPAAGDDERAKTEARDLLDLLGYDAVDAGTLAESRRFEPDTPVYVQPYLPPRPQGLSGDEDTMRWFLRCPGAVLSAGRVEALVRTATRQSPAAARERLN
ncbi:NAD(P)-binding domain-containing protein [Streptomyces sp. NPDC097610]|uniref:NADPH-dependent F420 reductase n=1 Tax=Streptomyces sp. NPDC097610 TaxID=3157227 RepID=UPI0033285BE6